jgi:CheY-like chemotaxis protein
VKQPIRLKALADDSDGCRMARILIADDDPEIRASLDKLLRMVGHEVQLAKDGHEAVRILETETFDLMITDIVMPRQDGLECLMHTRKKYPDLPLVAISGGGKDRTENYLKMAKAFGAAEIFMKPFSPKALLAKVDELVGQAPQPS